MNYTDRFFDLFMSGLDGMGIGRRRSELLSHAWGGVLEVGAGTGMNLAHYPWQHIDSLTVTDFAVGPLLHQRVARHHRVSKREADVEIRPADLMSLPFDSGSFDSVVVTFVLCSVPDQSVAVREIRRVLRPGGQLLFLEHVRPSGRLGSVADRINPAWHVCTGDCRINRETVGELERVGFSVDVASTAGGLLACGKATP